tara:strand:- start:486 stop:749 length:264 start_codon:yes stop_codon:yes gene_type:complete
MKYYVLERALGETPTGRKLLYSSDGDFLVASYTNNYEPEVLLFKSDRDGNISDWVECYGEKHDDKISINDAIHSTMARFNRTGGYQS